MRDFGEPEWDELVNLGLLGSRTVYLCRIKDQCPCSICVVPCRAVPCRGVPYTSTRDSETDASPSAKRRVSLYQSFPPDSQHLESHFRRKFGLWTDRTP